MHTLIAELDACQAAPRVFGSYGWQAISGLDHVRPCSDLDLSVVVYGAAQEDTVAQVLQSCGATQPRLDGELLFADGAGVAWREWIEWRAGRTRAVLVKRVHGVTLQRDTAWCKPVGRAQLSA
jgi:phosphoribosyl-dephospho-CoA transferase